MVFGPLKTRDELIAGEGGKSLLSRDDAEIQAAQNEAVEAEAMDLRPESQWTEGEHERAGETAVFYA